MTGLEMSWQKSSGHEHAQDSAWWSCTLSRWICDLFGSPFATVKKNLAPFSASLQDKREENGLLFFLEYKCIGCFMRSPAHLFLVYRAVTFCFRAAMESVGQGAAE